MSEEGEIIKKMMTPDKSVGKKKRAPKKAAAKDSTNKPKRALSSYMYFAKVIRPQIKEAQPELTFGELTKAIAARWATATPEEKAPYEQQALEDRARYQAEKAAADVK